MEVEVRIEVFLGEVHLQSLPLDHFLRAGDVGVVHLRCGQQLVIAIGNGGFREFGGLDVGRGLRTVEKLLDFRLNLTGFELVRRDFSQEFGAFELRL